MTQPTKSPSSENFPVASLLLAGSVRPQVLTFYHYARRADDIADTKDLSCPEKLAKLDHLEQEFNNPFFHDLLKAFRKDCHQNRYESFDELMDYCRYSANPVGRFLLSLHFENDDTALKASDALCSTLQILNHLQDCQKDYLELNRIYLPGSFLSGDAPYEELLKRGQTAPMLRAVLDQCLVETDKLMETARHFTDHIENWRLKFQVKVTLGAANVLSEKLKRSDPLASRVELTKMDKIFLILRGII